MRAIIFAAAISLSGCTGFLKGAHTEHAIEECEDAYVNADEVLACQHREREARRNRDMQQEFEKQDEEE